MTDVWTTGEAYEPYIGRWSRLAAAEFVRWLDPAPGATWLDVGCGTGALSGAIVTVAEPAAVVGVDPSPGYVAYAAGDLRDPRVRFEVGSATELPPGRFDFVVAGLVLNFVPDAGAALAAMRAAAPGGVVAAYVWDYAEGMGLIRHFWDAARELDPAARDLDEAVRFPMCDRGRLTAEWDAAGLSEVDGRAIDVPTRFGDFNDYWSPFLGGQGPAPTYLKSLSDERRAALRERLRERLPTDGDGAIPLVARAWAIRGRAPA